MVAKFVFDSSTYFSGIGNAWCHERMRKPEDIERLGQVLRPAIEMLPRMQELFRDWNALENTPFEGVSVLPKQLVPYIQAQADMAHTAEGDEVFENSAKNVEYLKALAVWIFHRAARNLPEPPDENRGINPLAISLHPGALGGGWAVLRRRHQPRPGARDAAGNRGDGSREARRGGGRVDGCVTGPNWKSGKGERDGG